MYECSNCGSNVKFDIRSQQLLCEHCSAKFSPYSLVKASDAEETYESTVYVCPQCGGEMQADENSVTEFCIYCGGANILTGKLTTQKRPGYIIPFRQTKEDCIAAYKKKMKRAIFAPSSLKKAEHMDKFCGIYIPYWSYRITNQGPVKLNGEKVHQEGNYTITEKFDINCDVDAYYRGFSHDAATGVADDISEKLAPFFVQNMEIFTPSYLSGFYADTADVTSNVYAEEYLLMANETTLEAIKRQSAFSGYTIKQPTSRLEYDQKLNTRMEKIDSTMYPVWFLTYRNKDRVVYAAVNGQTGKVAADIPVDSKKYILGSVLIAIPIFILLNMVFVLKPLTALLVVMLCMLISSIVYYSEIKKIVKREMLLEDRGYLSGVTKVNLPDGPKKIKINGGAYGATFGVVMVACLVVCPMTVSMMLAPSMAGASLCIVELLITVLGCRKIKKIYDMEKKICFEKESQTGKKKVAHTMSLSSYLGFFVPLLFSGIGSLIISIAPVGDWFYYAGALGCGIAVLYMFIEIINKYNLLSTRKLPRFHDRGGDRNE